MYNDQFDWLLELAYKYAHLDVDINNKSDRVEWGHVKYQSTFIYDQAYELVAQWVAASGSIISDLVS